MSAVFFRCPGKLVQGRNLDPKEHGSQQLMVTFLPKLRMQVGSLLGGTRRDRVLLCLEDRVYT